MAISLYDISVSSYLQVLGSLANVLAKGAQFAKDNNLVLEEIVESSLREDMKPFQFQVISVAHHSRGALEGARAGQFSPPPALDLDYAGLQGLVSDAIAALEALSAEEVNQMEGKAMLFKVDDFEIPFTVENFIQSFSLPNFYFHATTTYAILRMAGVPLGKMDFLGDMRIGT